MTPTQINLKNKTVSEYSKLENNILCMIYKAWSLQNNMMNVYQYWMLTFWLIKSIFLKKEVKGYSTVETFMLPPSQFRK